MTNELVVFIAAFSVSALAGLASLLRSSDPITVRKVVSHILNSGSLGLGVALLWYNKYIEDVFFLIGLCIFAGLTGVKGVETALNWAQKIAANFLKINEEKS